MARRIFAVMVAVAVVLLAAGVHGAGAAAAPATSAYIVVFRDLVNVDQKADEVEQEGNFSSEFRYRAALKGLAADLTAAQVARLAGDPEVAFITPDRPVHATGTVPIVSGDSAPTGVRRVEAATSTTAHQASTVNVAVIDTGVDLTHPDLNAMDGKNCVSTKPSPAQDNNGHGTHVAGTIAARNNGAGVVGVVPGTKVYAVKVLDSSGSGSDSQVICGIDWVTQNASALNIKVANMSLGRSGTNDNQCGNTDGDALHTAICNSTVAGVTYAVAAGNSARNSASFSPANYPEVLAVTAVTDSDGRPGGFGAEPTCPSGIGEADDTPASFSNFAVATTEINHTIAAPGVCISSTWWDRVSGSGYNTISGTSMSSPHVAGSIALCMGDGGVAGPCAGMTPAQVIQKLRSDAASHTGAVPGYGFTRDPAHTPTTGKYYGYLVFDGAPASPGFSLAANPSSVTFVANTTTTFDVTVTPSGGFTDPVTLTAASSSPNLSVTPVSSLASAPPYTVTFIAASALPGSYTATITGTSATLTHPVTVNVTVTPPPTVPGPPVLSATPGNGSVQLAWTVPADGGSPITGYKLYRGTSPGNENPTPVQTFGSGTTSYHDPGLVNGTTYYYTLRATNAVGSSNPSAEASAKPAALLDAFVLGFDNQLLWRRFNGNSWSAFTPLGGFLTSDIATVSNASGVWVFARGGDSATYYRRYNGTTWTAWTSMGGFSSSNPTAADAGSGTIRVFVSGGDNALYTGSFTGTGPFSGWASLGGFVASNAAAVNDGSGVRVFVRGGDNSVYTGLYTSGWSNWSALGGFIASDPAAVFDGSGTRVFARGGDNGLYTGKGSGPSFSGFVWQGLGGFVTATPTAALDSFANARVFVRGGDNGIYERSSVGNWATGYQALGNFATSNPTAVFDGQTTFAFTRGSDNGLWVGGFTGSWSGWLSLGGSVNSTTAVAVTR